MDRGSLKSRLIQILEEETWEKHESVEDDVDLRDGLNLDSVDLISIVLNVQNEFNVEVETHELETVSTVGDLLDLLATKISNSKAA